MRTFRVYAPRLINSGEPSIIAECINYISIAGLPEGMAISYIEIKAEDIGDEYHTMHELYQHRMALNVALFNQWARDWYVYHTIGGIIDMENASPRVMKSKLHHDGTMFEDYFIVMAEAPRGIGQISYHYKLKHWDKFKIPEVERTPPFDGHSSLDVMERLMQL